jgi:hypothetical protein
MMHIFTESILKRKLFDFFRPEQWLRFFLFTTASRPALGSSQPLSNGYRGDLSPEVKLSEREADHSPPNNAEVKNTWSYTFTPSYVFMAWYLIKYRDSFTFTWSCTQKLQWRVRLQLVRDKVLTSDLCGVLRVVETKFRSNPFTSFGDGNSHYILIMRSFYALHANNA